MQSLWRLAEGVRDAIGRDFLIGIGGRNLEEPSYAALVGRVFSAGGGALLPIADLARAGILAIHTSPEAALEDSFFVLVRGEDRRIVATGLDRIAPSLCIAVYSYNSIGRTDVFGAIERSEQWKRMSDDERCEMKRVLSRDRGIAFEPYAPSVTSLVRETWERIGASHPFLGIVDDLQDLSPEAAVRELEARCHRFPDVPELRASWLMAISDVLGVVNLPAAVELLQNEVRDREDLLHTSPKRPGRGLCQWDGVVGAVRWAHASFRDTPFAPLDEARRTYSGKEEGAALVLDDIAHRLEQAGNLRGALATLRNAAWISGGLQRKPLPSSVACHLRDLTVRLDPGGPARVIADVYASGDWNFS